MIPTIDVDTNGTVSNNLLIKCTISHVKQDNNQVANFPPIHTLLNRDNLHLIVLVAIKILRNL